MKTHMALGELVVADGVYSGDWKAVYLASEVDARIAELRGALADIAFSADMTIEVARAKAKRIYEQTT